MVPHFLEESLFHFFQQKRFTSDLIDFLAIEKNQQFIISIVLFKFNHCFSFSMAIYSPTVSGMLFDVKEMSEKFW